MRHEGCKAVTLSQHELAHVLRKLGHTFRFVGVRAIVSELVSVILHRHAATACRHHDRFGAGFLIGGRRPPSGCTRAKLVDERNSFARSVSSVASRARNKSATPP